MHATTAKKILDDLWETDELELFRKPVEYKKLNLIDYPLLIKNPMDLSTVRKKLKQNKYKFINNF